MQLLPPLDPEIQPPSIVVTDEEAAQIIEELNLIEIGPPNGKAETEAGKKSGIDVRKQIRLGIFAEHVGGVRLRGGAVLVAEQIALRHLQRLDAKAAKMESAEELKEMAYPIGYLQASIAKGSQKAKVVIEYVSPSNGEARGIESWKPGERVQQSIPAVSAA